jgi:two-component system phosphate regulon sensor histidine kinase PhoR
MSLRTRVLIALTAHLAVAFTLVGLWLGPEAIPALVLVGLLSLGGAWGLAGWVALSVERVAERFAAAFRDAGEASVNAPQAPLEFAPLAGALDAEAERVRRLSRERTHVAALIEATTDGIVAVDGEQRIAFLNASAARLFGIERAAAVGRGFLEVVRDHDIYDLLRTSLSESRQSQRVLAFGPQQRWLQVTAVPFAATDPWAGLVVLTDVTEVRRLERVRRDFVSNVSHELRTPVAGIKAASDTLAEGALDDPAAAREFVAHIQREADRLSQLVDELLELSRIESGEAPLRLEEIGARSLLDECASRMGALAGRAGVALRVDAPDGLTVRADRERIGRALTNLVHNAIRFTSPGGVVTLRARAEDGATLLEVSDTGAGIRPEDLPRIFERFYKAERARSGGGTGLGLAIVKHIAQAHGGSVSARSRPGQGSTFTLRLPPPEHREFDRPDSPGSVSL